MISWGILGFHGIENTKKELLAPFLLLIAGLAIKS